MAIVTGRVSTESGSKYLQQLCKHWSHKFEVEFTKTRGQIRFSAAVATLECRADTLLITLETDEAKALETVKSIVADHLNRFAFREAPLPFDWSPTEHH